jgi:preprotein translocase subunit SecY
MHDTLYGTPENPDSGLVRRVADQEKQFSHILNRLNLWGGILLGAFVASGVLNGKAAEVIHGIISGGG